MKRLLGWSFFAAVLTTLVVLPWLTLDATPAIEPPGEFRRADLAWIKSLFDRYDPRGQTPDMVHSIRLDETELNRLLNYAVELHRITGVATELGPGTATLVTTFVIPRNPFGRYLNLDARFAETPGGVRLDRLQIGSLALPGTLAGWSARLAHRWLRRDATYAALADAFVRVKFDENQATLDYRWHPELFRRLESKSAELLIAPQDQARMLAHAERLDALLKPYHHGSTVPLSTLVAPLFTDIRDDDAAAQNRAALTALGAYLFGISLPRLLEGEGRSIRRAPRVLLTLHGRRDFAEHFVISAALAANGGSRLANAIGLIKEEEDAKRGSGFSFTDLAANRAGARLGERATGGEAERLRELLATARSDADLLPDFRDLPEYMAETEFARRFGPVGGSRYQKVIQRIDARIDAHPLYAQ